MAGNYTFANFKTYVTMNLGNRAGLSTYLPVWVNAAYTELCSMNRVPTQRGLRNITFPELDTHADSATTDGSPYITRPSDCLHIHTVWDMSNDKKLDEKPREWYVEQTGRANTSSEGVPDFWIPGVYQGRTHLYSTPDDAYNMRTYFRKRPTRLVGDAETTEIGQEWDEPLLQLATIKAMMMTRDFGNAKLWRGEFTTTVSNLVGMQTKETKDFKGWFHPDEAYQRFGY